MTGFEIALVIIIVCSAAIVGAGFGIKYAQSKNVNVSNIIESAGTVSDTANEVFDKIKGLLPQTPALTIIETVLDLAEVGVNAAEKLYKTATIGKDDRYQSATEFVTDALKTAGVEITPEIEKVIEGAITGAVEMLPKTHDADGNVIS